ALAKANSLAGVNVNQSAVRHAGLRVDAIRYTGAADGSLVRIGVISKASSSEEIEGKPAAVDIHRCAIDVREFRAVHMLPAEFEGGAGEPIRRLTMNGHGGSHQLNASIVTEGFEDIGAGGSQVDVIEIGAIGSRK